MTKTLVIDDSSFLWKMVRCHTELQALSVKIDRMLAGSR